MSVFFPVQQLQRIPASSLVKVLRPAVGGCCHSHATKDGLGQILILPEIKNEYITTFLIFLVGALVLALGTDGGIREYMQTQQRQAPPLGFKPRSQQPTI